MQHDLATIKLADTHKFDLIQPDGKPLLLEEGKPQWLEVYGTNSAHYQAALDSLSNADANSKEKEILLLAKCVKRWGVIWNGKKSPVSEDRAVEIFTTVPWIGRRVEAAIFAERNYFSVASPT